MSEELDFTFDAEAAEQADNLATRIDTTGEYVGKLTGGRRIVAKTGTSGVLLSFESSDGQTVDLSLYCTKADGQHTFGYSQVQAILGLCGLKTGLRGAPGKAKVWDAEVGERVEQDVIVYPDLAGKAIGFVLRKRLYTKADDGKDGWSMELAAVFDAATGATWTEKKGGTMPVKIAKLLSTIKDKDERDPSAAKAADKGDDLPAGF